MKDTLAGKIAIVTGASKGIGQATAEALSREGAAVIVNYAGDADGAARAVASITARGGRAHAVQADIANAADVARLFRDTLAVYGRPDILVCNAGISGMTLLPDVTEEAFERIYNINVKGLLFLLKEASTHLNDNGRVITLSSSTSIHPRAGMAMYAGSKAAVNTITVVASQEFAPRGITVNAVLPGLTDTPMIVPLPSALKSAAASSSPFGRIGVPEDMSEVVAFLASDAARWVTGQCIAVNGGAGR